MKTLFSISGAAAALAAVPAWAQDGLEIIGIARSTAPWAFSPPRPKWHVACSGWMV